MCSHSVVLIFLKTFLHKCSTKACLLPFTLPFFQVLAFYIDLLCENLEIAAGKFKFKV